MRISLAALAAVQLLLSLKPSGLIAGLLSIPSTTAENGRSSTTAANVAPPGGLGVAIAHPLSGAEQKMMMLRKIYFSHVCAGTR